MAEALVVTTDRAEWFHPDKGVMAVIRPSPFRNQAMSRATVTQPGILRDGGRLLESPRSSGLHRYDDGVRTGRVCFLDQPVAIVGRIIAMRVDPDKAFKSASEFFDRKIHGRALDPLLIVDEMQAGIGCTHFRNNLPRAVLAAAIHDEDHHVQPLGRGRKLIDDGRDMAGLVETGNDNHRGPGISGPLLARHIACPRHHYAACRTASPARSEPSAARRATSTRQSLRSETQVERSSAQTLSRKCV